MKGEERREKMLRREDRREETGRDEDRRDGMRVGRIGGVRGGGWEKGGICHWSE